LHTGFIPARNELETLIAKAWSEVLGVETVGVRDNFFDLGGHSLRMVHVQSKLAQVLASAPSLLELFEYPTVESLAKHLSKTETPAPGTIENRGIEELKKGRSRLLQRARDARTGGRQ
jgi:hypothetical protein